MTTKKIDARWYKKGNTKVGAIWTFSTLMGDNEYNTCYGKIFGTCGSHCQGCKNSCYVTKSYRYPSVIEGQARNTLAVRFFLDKAVEQLSGYVRRARKKPVACRFHQSGEIETLQQLLAYSQIAKENPEQTFYIYSKNYSVVVPALLAGFVPGNLVVLISVWHENGIKEYNRVKHLDNVKAFVYMDGYDYSKHGLTVNTMCNAYDVNGKLDHDITCDKCKKCFNKLASCKVIGCFDH